MVSRLYCHADVRLPVLFLCQPSSSCSVLSFPFSLKSALVFAPSFLRMYSPLSSGCQSSLPVLPGLYPSRTLPYLTLPHLPTWCGAAKLVKPLLRSEVGAERGEGVGCVMFLAIVSKVSSLCYHTSSEEMIVLRGIRIVVGQSVGQAGETGNGEIMVR